MCRGHEQTLVFAVPAKRGRPDDTSGGCGLHSPVRLERDRDETLYTGLNDSVALTLITEAALRGGGADDRGDHPPLSLRA
jgi:hypothetical protein